MAENMPLRWGFIGAGRIARLIYEGIKRVPDAQITAVFDSFPGVAAAFAGDVGAKNVYTDFDEFLNSRAFDIAYIALPHPFHLEYASKALNAGYPTLCEKPICPNYKQAEQLVECARKNNLFLMEGNWTRFFPVSRQVCEWIAAGKIGRLIAANCIFTFVGECVPGNRLYEPSLAGGTILDIGVYCVDYMNMLFGREPEKIAACCSKVASGVDDAAAVSYTYDDGAVATFLTSFYGASEEGVSIVGTEGVIHVDGTYWRPRAVTLANASGTVRFDCPVDGRGFQYEIIHVQDCIRKGLTESPIKPLKDSLAVIDTCDKIREQLGIRYPFE